MAQSSNYGMVFFLIQGRCQLHNYKYLRYFKYRAIHIPFLPIKSPNCSQIGIHIHDYILSDQLHGQYLLQDLKILLLSKIVSLLKIFQLLQAFFKEQKAHFHKNQALSSNFRCNFLFFLLLIREEDLYSNFHSCKDSSIQSLLHLVSHKKTHFPRNHYIRQCLLKMNQLILGPKEEQKNLFHKQHLQLQSFLLQQRHMKLYIYLDCERVVLLTYTTNLFQVFFQGQSEKLSFKQLQFFKKESLILHEFFRIIAPLYEQID